ncbi:MAG: Fe-S oxidoreductase [Candidatus Synechococcus spongiarum 142]|uniref:Fe-S oxidoreductase n=1 Tax=Candidatus Synechococcus spongiarum 142 TaxID=1608213 RepID=A0A6N3XA27_9SYNE|nr:MAG: Fe-S oxidoreductase [Candidatus Synechococcus spongiarum 142]
MWREPQPTPVPDGGAAPEPALVTMVEAGSIAAELGVQRGDKVLRINGVAPRDLIDYRILIGEEELKLEVLDTMGQHHCISFEKDMDEDLGLEFSEALFDGLRQCNNRCPFCFIDQQPAGKRSTLYLKDDDYRLSFLYGSYLTLTNLTPADWQRIETQRLSPLYVSVHATDPDLRCRLLRNKRAGFILQQLEWFAQRRLQIHAQVVVCPGINDGHQLQHTLCDLARWGVGDWPTVLSIAVVPVGLTRFRPDDSADLMPVTPQLARQVIAQVEALQREFHPRMGSRFAWLADEWYLMAAQPLPPRSTYEDWPQQANGVGSIRAFLEALDQATAQLPQVLPAPRRCSWVVGGLVGPALRPVAERLQGIQGLELLLYSLPSPYWGQDLVVTGLLTGSDLIDGLAGQDLGDQLLLPSVMLRHGSPLFLDDRTVSQVAARLGVPILPVADAQDLVAACLGEQQQIDD